MLANYEKAFSTPAATLLPFSLVKRPSGTFKQPMDEAHGAMSRRASRGADLDEASLALKGINMLLNNGFQDAEELFQRHRFVSTCRRPLDDIVLTVCEEDVCEDYKVRCVWY